MKNYRKFSAEDFLTDESFQRWQVGSVPEDAAFWEQWMRENPAHLTELRRAEQLVTLLRTQPRNELPPDQLDAEVNRLIARAIDREPTPQTGQVRPLHYWVRWAAAACLTAVVGLGVWYNTQQKPRLTANQQPVLPATVTGQQERLNHSEQTVNVLLADGSIVVLGPHSRLSYPNQFGTHSRAVFLTGEAFFEIVKNPTKPFLVYTNQTVTKVLGTSFSVRATPPGPVAVAVRTGRVSVYGRADYEAAQRVAARRIRGVLLTANQQAVYYPASSSWSKGLVETPVVLNNQAPSQQQVFDNIPVTTILKTLERSYGVDLVFDEAGLAACPLTTTFTDENLLERLDIICHAIGTSYEVIDGQIIVTGQGCR